MLFLSRINWDNERPNHWQPHLVYWGFQDRLRHRSRSLRHTTQKAACHQHGQGNSVFQAEVRAIELCMYVWDRMWKTNIHIFIHSGSRAALLALSVHLNAGVGLPSAFNNFCIQQPGLPHLDTGTQWSHGQWSSRYSRQKTGCIGIHRPRTLYWSAKKLR